MAATASSTMLAGVQSGRQPAMSYRKCSSTRCPAWVCSTSGCHCTPASPRSASSKAAIGAPGAAGQRGEAGRRRGHRVAVAHPDPQAARAGRPAGCPGRVDRGLGAAELAQPGPGHVPAEGPGHRLEAVADAEGRHARSANSRGSTWGAPGAYTDCGPPDRMIAFGRRATISATRGGVRHDLGVDPRLADPAGDQLGVLGAEVDHHDQVVVRLAHRARLRRIWALKGDAV